MRRPDIEAGLVAAWVLKCDPDEVYDLGHRDSGLWSQSRGCPVDTKGNWSLGHTYRSWEMAPGDRCFFWVSGDFESWPSGLWGELDILGVPTEGTGGRGYIDKQRRRRVDPYLPVRFRFLSRPVLKATVRNDPRLIDSELVNSPQMTNPVALYQHEVDAIDDLIRKRPKLVVSRGKR